MANPQIDKFIQALLIIDIPGAPFVAAVNQSRLVLIFKTIGDDTLSATKIDQ
jgi:hypothetical protein